jgi:hypothetical protein
MQVKTIAEQLFFTTVRIDTVDLTRFHGRYELLHRSSGIIWDSVLFTSS